MEQKKFPSLYGKSSTGKFKLWKIKAETYKGKAAVITEYGYEDGEMQYTLVEINKGKNIGRTNETTPFEQACSEAESKWNKKRDKKYAEKKEDLGTGQGFLPMLALPFTKRRHDIKWPAFIQPKLNGIRCLAHKVSEEEILYLSRGGKRFGTLDHLTPHLLQIMSVDEILDGELFTIELTFQEIVAAVKREKTTNPNIKLVEYWVYDCVRTEDSFAERNRHLLGMLPHEKPIVTVPTLEVRNERAMKKLHANFIRSGYEGTIIRNKEGVYRCDYRSKNLQKFKDFLDEEFKIVGAKDGIGKFKASVIWICHTEDGKEFDVVPRGTMEKRREWWQNRAKFFGKQITVRYQNRSDDNIPIFPVGIAIRDYE